MAKSITALIGYYERRGLFNEPRSQRNRANFSQQDLDRHVYGHAEQLNEWVYSYAKALDMQLADILRLCFVNFLEMSNTHKRLAEKDEAELKRRQEEIKKK